MNGAPQRLQTCAAAAPNEMPRKACVPYLDPLPRFEITPAGQHPAHLRARRPLRAGTRHPRTAGRTGPARAPAEQPRPRHGEPHRSRSSSACRRRALLDPTLNFLGTNDHPGDYRSSGCTACHVIYANDRSPVHSGPYAEFGNRACSVNADPTIPKDEPGHPDPAPLHAGAIPSSQCIVCHIHPGTNVMNSYLGYMWWDEETDGELMYPHKQKYPTAEEMCGRP